MNERIEEQLRQHLAAVDRAPVQSTDTITAASQRAGHRLRRRRHIGLAAASAVLLAVGAVAVGTSLDRSNDAVTPTDGISTTATEPSTTQVAPTSSWARIAPDPRGTASFPSVVWTGREAIAIGGLDDEGQPRAGASAFDPATNSWRRLADPPATLTAIDPLVAWSGTEMLVIGGDNPDGSLLVSSGHAYDPVTDAWTLIASPPVGFVSDRSPRVWTGRELLVWPWDGGGPSMRITPIGYDPAADTWRELPEPPISRRQQAASVWTGAAWIVWGGTSGSTELGDGAAYDPDTNSWRVIAESPLSARRVQAVWTGTEMIVDAGSSGGDRVSGNGELALSDGAAYDPAVDTWRSITSGLAHPGFVPLWTGTQMLLFAKGSAVVYDVASDRWVDTCCSETSWGGGTPVWTGSVALLIGSFDPDAGGATFTP